MIALKPEMGGAVEGALGAQAAPPPPPAPPPCAAPSPWQPTASPLMSSCCLSKALTSTLCLFYYSFCTFWLPFPQGTGCTGEMFLLGEWEMGFLSISMVFTTVGEAQQRAGWNYSYQCQ